MSKLCPDYVRHVSRFCTKDTLGERFSLGVQNTMARDARGSLPLVLREAVPIGDAVSEQDASDFLETSSLSACMGENSLAVYGIGDGDGHDLFALGMATIHDSVAQGCSGTLACRTQGIMVKDSHRRAGLGKALLRKLHALAFETAQAQFGPFDKNLALVGKSIDADDGPYGKLEYQLAPGECRRSPEAISLCAFQICERTIHFCARRLFSHPRLVAHPPTGTQLTALSYTTATWFCRRWSLLPRISGRNRTRQMNSSPVREFHPR